MIVVERLTHFIEQRTNELMRKYLKSAVEQVSKTCVKEDEETLLKEAYYVSLLISIICYLLCYKK